MKNLKMHAPEEVQVVLVGTQSEEEEKRQVEKKEGEEFAKKWGISFYEASAKKNINVSEAFFDLSNKIYENLFFFKRWSVETFSLCPDVVQFVYKTILLCFKFVEKKTLQKLPKPITYIILSSILLPKSLLDQNFDQPLKSSVNNRENKTCSIF